ADERVDADALLERPVGPNTLDHHHTALQAGERFSLDHERAALIADAHAFALVHAELAAIVGMDEDGRPALPRLRSPGLGEGRIEIVARRSRDEPERAIAVGFVDDVEEIGEARHARMVGADPRPIRLEMELAVGMPEAVEVMLLLEGLHAVLPTPVGD